MKKSAFILLFIMLLSMLCGCGNISDVEIVLDSSNKYSETDLNSAVDVVKNYFWYNFDKCKLKKIIYDEDLSESVRERNIIYYNADDAITLTLTFDGEIFEQEVNNDFREVILTRSGDKNWQVSECGYP